MKNDKKNQGRKANENNVALLDQFEGLLDQFDGLLDQFDGVLH